ncbi:magnesium ion transporter [Neophaeococcomyces mojaviensis]|uniref:Magnesium ion transporter n=1 Tax=Neophaeococcomyces mojaviensis TaxID=3383035 RepID=A0ACC3ABN6_9EURO|nr:magnesium ion transporter [Knufia sp. JES_112]
MSALTGVPAPSSALLRFLRSQSDGLCHLRSAEGSSRTYREGLSHVRPRQPCLVQRRCYASPRSYIDDLFARNREKCRALPAPKSHPPYSPYHPNRHVSSDTSPTRYDRPSWWSRIWNRRREWKEKQNDEEHRPLPDYSFSPTGNSYEESSAQLFNLSRALSRNPTGAELKLRCTEFDKNGSVTLVSGEFKKSELIAKYGLLPRDLRKIDSSVLPHILVRPTAILINLLHLRVLIQSDRVLVFDAYGSTDSYTQSLFMYDLEGKLRQKTAATDAAHSTTYLPYEFRALEAVLISVTSGLEAEFALVRDPVTHILRALEEDIDREKLRHLLIHSKKLGTFEQKARLVRDALYELLEADDDLASMYLTERKQTGKPRAEQDHQEIEMLLESYHKICDEVVEISGNLISNIRNTEEVVKAILDANRNQLMLFEIKVSIATLGLAGGTLIAGFYGMNLENFIEETNWGFGAVTSISFILSGWICVYGLRKLRKVQKVRMWGEGGMKLYNGNPTLRSGQFAGSSNRGNWRSEAMEILAAKEREWRGVRKSTSPGTGTGPVLWPGMEGLGLHKLNTPSNDGSEPTNSDADDYGRPDPPTVNVKDDTAIGLRDKTRM